MALTPIFLLSLIWSQPTNAITSLNIDTTSGVVHGFIDKATPSVAQFLGIPFAEPPVGARRWLPPSRKSKKNGIIEATKFAPACPQIESDPNVVQDIWISDAPEFLISPSSYLNEDCLSVNVWTPWQKNPVNGSSGFPVIAWLHGGGFQTGGGSVPYQNPSQWIEKSRRHIVVGINYRLNIFGFPNSAGLSNEEQNLGLLDQRLGLEWIRDNVANFGGDPNRITLWGQSAGAISADDYNFAYPEDSIISGLIMNSGSSLLPLENPDTAHTNFTFIARQFQCNNDNAQVEVDCMRNISSVDIINHMKALGANGTITSFTFVPIVDNCTKFSDYTARAQAGKFARVPALIGTTINEGVVALPYNRTYGPSQMQADALTAAFFLCPAVKTTQNRYAAGVSTFRYLYGGNFTNISPQWWEGAYHASELPLIFGTYGIARGKGMEFQKRVSEALQESWLAFAEDPVQGLRRLGWNEYRPEGEAYLVGYKDEVFRRIAESRLEAPCNGTTPNGSPLPP